ncbi:hypothetical protein LO772_12230 [Yinghuangia sp. ASG 101]|uniref:hypothetical protein n=1 Tax=Yinghuangia sp. ASG 101 TaxID=2896848 RepID=UPI001E39AA4D|nr:hypothetical protein [Yinghuangia sp. ASG 101]UGQ14283.1 hypothetical protein LO772_12230 [Yinghuangia sp. ASG 101]
MQNKSPEGGFADEGNAWHHARQAVMELRDVLIAAGMEAEFKFLTADVNAFGRGIVSLGRVSPETARRLARLLRAARESMGDEAFASGVVEGGDDHG